MSQIDQLIEQVRAVIRHGNEARAAQDSGESYICELRRVEAVESIDYQALLAELEAAKRVGEALRNVLADAGGGKKACGHNYTCVCAWDAARAAIGESAARQQEQAPAQEKP